MPGRIGGNMFFAAENYVNQAGKLYNVGVYVRLSREDVSREGQSESIKNQTELLTKFIIESGWNVIDIYVDDGFSGTNFDRPGFKRMIGDIEKGLINMVVVKDLSRLGRDYIDTGYYFEKYFPSKNIRFIAVTDGIDTFANTSNNDMSPFKSVINDLYAKDISKKVKAAVDTKRRNGKFIGSFAPYGYLKDPYDKNKLIINPETADVVEKIFSLYLSGNSLRQIALILNEEGIESPALYKQKNTTYHNGKVKYFLWLPETVRLILSNPTYTGNMSQNKCSKINYKLKKFRNVPREEWTVVENTHEPIVDTETFNLVQQMLKIKASQIQSIKPSPHLLSGLVYCGDCGARMTFLQGSNKIYYAVCSNYKRFKQCKRHSFPEKRLEEIILNELKNITAKALDMNKLNRQIEKQVKDLSKDSKHEIDKEICLIEKRIDDIKLFIKNLYEDKVRQIISEENFLEFTQNYNKEREKLYGRLDKLRKEKQDQLDKSTINGDWIKMVHELVSFEKIDKAALVKLIQRIEIYEEGQLKIFYNFKCPF